MSESARSSVEKALILTLFDLANHLARRGEELASVADLTAQQWLVLLQIAGDPNFPGAVPRRRGIVASEIARQRGVTRANLSAPVAALLRRGLVRRVEDRRDRRRKLLSVTAAGRAALETIEPLRRQANRLLFAELSAGERRELLQTATKLPAPGAGPGRG